MVFIPYNAESAGEGDSRACLRCEAVVNGGTVDGFGLCVACADELAEHTSHATRLPEMVNGQCYLIDLTGCLYVSCLDTWRNTVSPHCTPIFV